jgi:polar amino acid transport system substrate-binding protein
MFARTIRIAALLALVLSGQVQAQELTVAADVGFAPHIMAKPTGGHEGFNVDLIEAIAKKMGRTAKIVDQQFSGIFAGLNAKKYDFIIAPTTVTEERAKSLLFTEGYIETDHQFIIKKGEPAITKLEDLKGKIIAVNNGNLYDRWASEREAQYGWTIQRYGKNADALQAVLTGRAHTNMVGTTVGGWFEKTNPQLQRSLVIPTGQVFAIPFRKDDVETRNRVEAILECLKKDGTVAAIAEKWIGYRPASDSVAFKTLPGFGQPGFEGHMEGTPAACS